MKPYVREGAKDIGAKRPKAGHRPHRKGITQRQKDSIKSHRRALKKSIRQETRKKLKKIKEIYENPYLRRAPDGTEYLGEAY